MPCQVLTVGLEQDARPQGALEADARPQGDGMCRSFSFTQPSYYVTLVDSFPIVTFSGLRIQTLPQDG